MNKVYFIGINVGNLRESIALLNEYDRAGITKLYNLLGSPDHNEINL